MKPTLLIAAMIAVASASFSAYAGQDEAQRQMIVRAMAAKQKLQQAEAAKGEKRKMLMTEHMKMMKEMMDQMSTMKPKAGISPQEHEEWLAEHQKLMQQMLDQMQGQHQLMMQMK
jgi:5-formaminoimidazole-4-carboxamide-1-beta-D-ribofuranosyl 5'-monophosphate synthetase